MGIAIDKAREERAATTGGLKRVVPVVARALRRLRTACPRCGAWLAPRVRRDATCSYCGSWFAHCIVAD